MFRQISYKTIVSVVYLIAVMMETIDVTIVNVALPNIQTALYVPINLMGWITNGYVLALATAIPISGWLGERYGTKKILLVGIAIFTIASMACGLSTNIHTLNIARVIQGIGGGMLVPVGQTILFRAFDSDELPSLLSKLSIPLTLAPALGQTMGGLIVQYLSWQWIFWINLPFGLFCFFGTKKWLQESKTTKNKLDIFGLLLSSIAIFVLFYSFSIIDFQATLTKPVLYFVSACVLLFGFVLYEKRQEAPFFNLKVFSNKNFSLSILCSLLIFSNIMGTFFISNFVFQETLGFTAFEAGLTAVPFCIGLLIALKTLPKIYPDKIGTVKLLVFANSINIIGSLLMNFLYSNEQFNLLLFGTFLRGLGFGFLIITLQTVGLSGIKDDLMNDASSVITLTRYTFAGFGTALFIVLSVIFMNIYTITPVSFKGNTPQTIAVFHWLYNIATVFMILSFPFILQLKKETNVEKQHEKESLKYIE